METKEIIKKLNEYKIICDKAIDEAEKIKIEGAINWADLKCNEVKYILNNDGENYYEFIIDEADPINDEFQRYISDYISDVAGINEDFQIITEW